ncbi:hypothetical protein EZV62_009135 [Acer yangbiense]|uniref:Phytocyanin domain-containing protein n=1 Tax=Acer yangbiense TaxID=1000413 RepID=A0A5C7IEU7_9ROSI|nr:hypothetical protein EZV62_009135 [Acer yangbiense]
MASLMSLILNGDQYQKRKRGGGAAYHALGFLCVMLFIQKSCATTQFLVGGKGNWGAPTDNSTVNYNQWAESQRFQIGYSLVLQVTREAYTNCSTTDTPMANFTDGHTVFTFNRSGAFYFISGNEDNCKNNEKLVVVVLADRSQHNSTQTNIAPSPAPAGEDSPPSGTVEINPTPAPESPPNAASYTSISLAGSIIGAVFAASEEWEITSGRDWRNRSSSGSKLQRHIRGGGHVVHSSKREGVWRSGFKVDQSFAQAVKSNQHNKAPRAQEEVGDNHGIGSGFGSPSQSFSSLGIRGIERKAGDVSNKGVKPNLIKRKGCVDGLLPVKGKEIWVRKPKLRSKPFLFGNSSINLAKNKGVGGIDFNKESESSSSSDVVGDRLAGFFRYKGENSNAGNDFGMVSTDEAQILALNYKSPSPPLARFNVTSSGPVLVSNLDRGKGPSLNVWVDLTNKAMGSKDSNLGNSLVPQDSTAQISVSSSKSPGASTSDGTVV